MHSRISNSLPADLVPLYRKLPSHQRMGTDRGNSASVALCQRMDRAAFIDVRIALSVARHRSLGAILPVDAPVDDHSRAHFGFCDWACFAQNHLTRLDEKAKGLVSS